VAAAVGAPRRSAVRAPPTAASWVAAAGSEHELCRKMVDAAAHHALVSRRVDAIILIM
jgi:hypothetical protein